jgi:BlaI family transcriptional regulator, penicillinase repressor
MKSQSKLSDLEQQVMQIVWNHGKATAAEIQAALVPKRALKDSTVRTILTRLEEKGYVEHEVDGRTFVYRGLERPNQVAGRAVKQILDRFCHGSLESLLTGMVDDELVDPEELKEITERLALQRKRKKEETK